jgi:tetratricopeptide (TPR) repeat protein
MRIDHRKIVGEWRGPRLLWLLPLAALALILWQIPLVDMAHRQAGTRAFLQMVFQSNPSLTDYQWSVFVDPDAEALESVTSHLKQANRELDTERLLGLVALATDKPADAQGWLQRRLETAPEDVIARFFLGEAYLRLGNTSAAIEQWEAAGTYRRLMELARDLAAHQAQDEALSALGAVVRLDETNVDARKLAAEIWVEQGDVERALALYQEIIAIAPQKADGYILSGQLLFDEGQYEQASVFFEQALQCNPTQSRWILKMLGSSHAALGQWPEAVEAYEQALREDPTPGIYALTGDALCQLGLPEKARFHYEQAIMLGDQSRHVRKVAEYIAQHGDCPP